MTKADLIEYIAENADLTKADAGRALEAAIEGIVEGLKKEKKVSLVGFGSFLQKIVKKEKDVILKLEKRLLFQQELLFRLKLVIN